MKQRLAEFFPLSDKELHHLWEYSTFVFDTNVLLGLYRLPRSAREEYIAVIKSLRDRVWIPHHVALEFNLRRPRVIAQQRKLIENRTAKISDNLADALREVNDLEIAKHLKDYAVGDLTGALKSAAEEFAKVGDELKGSLATVSSHDPIRDELEQIFSGKVGEPFDKISLDKLQSDGEERYKNRIPPGFADAKKDDSGDENTFNHAGLKFKRKFGDLVIWQQTLEFAKKQSKKEIIFVTADNKEDWWWKEGSTALGPHPSLRREIASEAGVTSFWMYNSAQFAKFASEQIHADFSPQSLREIKAASLFSNVREAYPSHGTGQIIQTSIARKPSNAEKSRHQAVKQWYDHIFDRALSSGSYPDIIAYDDTNSIAAEILTVRSPPDILFSSLLGIELSKLERFANENDFTTAQLVILFESEDKHEAYSLKELYPYMLELVSNSSSELTKEIIIGYIGRDDEFVLDQIVNSEIGIIPF
ncbi:PIN-like domain-containing protein [Qipengyuania flava]|uniref:PIN-like domain-containing protein n=1 Tax=Qipengyuania flava TaxID=192812 RepID=UPI001CD50C60|nr:PIN domain-containing protein [Qipengyuania flava]MCA0890850.1 PIN domain-containing protein [Qipengyuania flava]